MSLWKTPKFYPNLHIFVKKEYIIFTIEKVAQLLGYFFTVKRLPNGPGGVAQWTSHPTLQPMTRFRIPPEHKVVRENIAMLLSIIN
jgi:hypothetical protein